MVQDRWLHGLNYNVEEWDADGLHYAALAICRYLAHARVVFKEAISKKPTGWFVIRSRTSVVKRISYRHATTAQGCGADNGGRSGVGSKRCGSDGIYTESQPTIWLRSTARVRSGRL
jgi:hypothetical protein